MSLYGALFGGVSGLRAQSSKIGIISDNIANVNTIGYKQASATFQSLVVNSNSSVSYQTGGVRAATRLEISKQGLLQSTESPTDLAISGGGFFVVRGVADASAGGTAATPYYTRAGSFTQDSLGNFVNGAGYFLQGWPLDSDGRLPGEPGNLNTTSFTNFDSLEAVNVESASGVAQATSSITIGANLKAGEVIYPGAAGTLSPDALTTNNRNLAADAILVGSEFGLATTNGVRRGDQMTVSTGNGLSFDYTYGGFVVGRNVSTTLGSVNYGDGGVDNTALIAVDTALDVSIPTVGATAASFDITIPSHGLISGDTITLNSMPALGNTPAAELNATHTITRIDANTVRITTSTPHAIGATGATGIAGSATADTHVIYAGNIFDASSNTQTFLGQIGTTGFSPAALTFTIAAATSGTVTFTYTNSSPNTLSGQFNNLNSLAAAINSVNGLTARVSGGRLIVAAENSSEAITFANGDATGTSTKRGLDWVKELDMADITTGNRRFATLDGLANLVTSDDGISAVINNPLSASSLDIRVDDPLDTIQFQDLQDPNFPMGTDMTFTAGIVLAGNPIDIVITDAAPPATLNAGDFIYISGVTDGTGGLPGSLPNGGPYQVTQINAGVDYTIRLVSTQDINFAGGTVAVTGTVSIAGESNQGSLLAQLGLTDSLNGAAYVPGTAIGTDIMGNTGTLGPQYSPSGVAPGKNMASGDITAQFSRNVRIYDSLGSGHDIRLSFIKTATNTWATEVHAIPETDISTTLVDGQIATGNIIFNGDGTLRSISEGLTLPVSVNWTNGAVASTIDLDLGTAGQPFGTPNAAIIGLTDGLSQFDSAYNVNFANQNGAPVGQLVSVSIDKSGVVIASYSNGQTQGLYKLPLAEFANPDGLNANSGNVYSQTRDSGEVNLREAGTNGTGSVVSAALEQSNTDLAEQLTDMIVAQRSYQANTKVIKTADELLDQLNQI